MHILVIHQYFLQKGGTGGSRFNEMARIWEEQGNEVTVLAGMIYHNSGNKYPEYEGKRFVKEQYSESVKVIRCHDAKSGQKNFISRLKVYLTFVFYSIYAGMFKAREKYDVIVVTSPPLFVGITGYVLSFFKRIPFVFEIRDLWPESAIDTGVLTNKSIIKLALWFERLMYRKAKLINVLTPAFRDTLTHKKNVSKNKIILIPNAADFSLIKEMNPNFSASLFKKELKLEDKFVITYVGAHGVANHLIQLVEAAKHLRNTNVVFQMIGDGMEKKWLIEEVNKADLKNVIFRDPVSKMEVFKYILASDVGASVLKKADTFKTIYSNKTFDYMSCKKPVLLAIDGASRDLINEAGCGVYVEPENTEQIVKGIRELLEKDDNELKLMGEKGYNYAQENFHREKLGVNYLSELESIIE